MIIYNVTMKVDWSIQEDWMKWMHNIYIPGIINTGYFDKYQFVRLVDVDDADGPTYAVQYYSASLNTYNTYVREFAPMFSTTLHRQWGNRCLAFGTLMEVINNAS